MTRGLEAADATRPDTTDVVTAGGSVVVAQRRRPFVLRHPVVSVLLLALTLRATTALALHTFFGGAVFADDSTYVLLATQVAAGRTAVWDDYTRTLYASTLTYTAPLAAVFSLLGPSVLLGQLLTACFGAASAALTTRCAVELLPVRWALAAGATVALVPSQVLFSSLVLKDAAVWAVLAGLAAAMAVLGRSTGRRVVLPLLVVTALLLLLGHLRIHTLVAAAWAVGLAAVFGVAAWRGRRLAAVLIVAVVVPWFLALGPAGLGLVLDAQGTLETRRQNNAAGAATAYVPPARPARPAPGAAATPKPSPAPDAEPASPPITDDEAGSAVADLRHLPRGLTVMLLEPLPGNDQLSNRRVQLAFAENLVWWPLLALAAVGLALGRSQLRVLAFPALSAGAIAVLYALSEGNFGTAFRHRGEIVWAVALLAWSGAHALRRRSGRSPATATWPPWR